MPYSQHVLEKGVMWIWPFLLPQPLSISIRLDRLSTYVLTMLWDYVLGQLYVLHVHTRSTFPPHPSRFYCPGTLPSRPPRLYHALIVFSLRFCHLFCVPQRNSIVLKIFRHLHIYGGWCVPFVISFCRCEIMIIFVFSPRNSDKTTRNNEINKALID